MMRRYIRMTENPEQPSSQSVCVRSSTLPAGDTAGVDNPSEDADGRSFLRLPGPSGGRDSSRLAGMGVTGFLTVCGLASNREGSSRAVLEVAGTLSPSSPFRVRFLFLPSEGEGEGGVDGEVEGPLSSVLEENWNTWEDGGREEKDMPVRSEGDLGYSGGRTRPNESVFMDVDNWRCLAMISLGPQERVRR